MPIARKIERAIIFSAGKGSRLLPLTADRPKCLIDLAGRTLIEWQLDSLFGAGITEMVVVGGFGVGMVEEVLARRGSERGKVSLLFNPFYHVADNLGSAWIAKEAMDEDFLILNGDTLVPPALVSRLIAAPEAPITLAVDRKDAYDADDMKVLLDGSRLVRVGKGLSPGGCNAEAIGISRYLGSGAEAFRNAVEEMMRSAEGTAQFYLRVIDRLADTGIVHGASIEGIDWAEVDYPADLEAARALTARWAAAERSGGAGPMQAEPFA